MGGTKGHAVYPPLMQALNEWAVGKMRSINWYFKGQNNRAEMYSALKAEVEVADDPTTKLDTELIATLAKHKKADIVLLEDAASAVGGFEEVAKTFVEDMRNAGVTVCKSADVVPP